MIEKILERLTNEARASSSALTEAIIGMQGASADFYSAEKSTYEKAIEIVQEVVKDDGWVSVDDYLPAHDEIVLVYYECQHIDGYNMIKLYGIGCWDDEFECWKIDAHHKMKADVLAWMPLPPRYAPYQKGE